MKVISPYDIKGNYHSPIIYKPTYRYTQTSHTTFLCLFSIASVQTVSFFPGREIVPDNHVSVIIIIVKSMSKV